MLNYELDRSQAISRAAMLVQEPGRTVRAGWSSRTGLRLAVREKRSAGLDTRRLGAITRRCHSQAREFPLYIGSST